MCLIEPITSIENPWDVIGEYRRPSLLGGYETYANFSAGNLFDYEYTYNEVLTLDIAGYCCNRLDEIFSVNITGLPDNTSSLEAIALTGWPAGGTFSGPGVVFSAFNPSIAGPGNHTITYTVNDEFGCSFSIQQNIFVFTITFNFVNYTLGTISPKISNEINIELEVPEPNQYTFQVFNMNGQLLAQQDEQFEVGIHQQEIKLNQQLAKGV